MDEVKPNFTEELRNVIKLESQEMDTVIYSTQFLERQNTETPNFENSVVGYENQDKVSFK